jgi:hypothetical protein
MELGGYAPLVNMTGIATERALRSDLVAFPDRRDRARRVLEKLLPRAEEDNEAVISISAR